MSNIIKLFNANNEDDGYVSSDFIYFKKNSDDTIYKRKSSFTMTTNETLEQISIFIDGSSQLNFVFGEYYKNKAATEIMGSTFDLAVASILSIID